MVKRYKKLKKLVIPYYPTNDDKEVPYNILTIEERYVYEYTGYTFKQIDELDCISFWVYLRDAFIYKMSKTEDGRKYLQDCYRLTQTKPDNDRLREVFG